MKEFLYIPSFDTGIAAAAGKKNIRLKDGTPWRFWTNEYPEKYKHEAFLVTAGHSYKKFDYSSLYEFTDDTVVFADSGGYQLASGAIKWDPAFKVTMFNWLENNSTVAMNLDIPPRMKYANKFSECLNISYNNFKYFADNQTGKTDFINIIQGSNYEAYTKWYQAVKGLPFKGWAIGGTGGSFTAMLSGVVVLLENGELTKNKDVKWLHFLGASSVSDFIVLTELQKSLHKINPNIQVTVDSSTPSRTSAFGYYFLGYNYKNLHYQYLQIGRKEKYKEENIKSIKLPIPNIIAEKIWDTWSFEEFIEWKSDHYGWLVNYNFSIFKDLIKDLNLILNSDKWIYEQLFPSNMNMLIKAIDEIILSDKPYTIFKKYYKIIDNQSRLNMATNIEIESHSLFN